MISFLRDHGLLNAGDVITISLFLITFAFFLVRTGIHLYFNRFGVPFQAEVVGFEMVPVLKNRIITHLNMRLLKRFSILFIKLLV